MNRHRNDETQQTGGMLGVQTRVTLLRVFASKAPNRLPCKGARNYPRAPAPPGSSVVERLGLIVCLLNEGALTS